jgi:MOSC domain-containing protein YiiM
MSPITLLSIQVGKPKRYPPGPEDNTTKPWRSGIYKSPVTGPVWLGETNLEGDGQADHRFHGGPTRAVMAYSADHYPYWKQLLGREELEYGSFGENFTVHGWDETTALVGDMLEVGEAVVKVTERRGPCWKVERRTGIPGLVSMIIDTGYSGWYLGVVQEGFVEAGQEIRLIARDPSAKSIDQLNREFFARRAARDSAA